MTSEEFKEIRKHLALTQVELAEMLGIDPVSISRIENGHRNISRRLAKYLETLIYVHES